MTTKRPKLDPVTLRWAAGILAERAKGHRAVAARYTESPGLRDLQRTHECLGRHKADFAKRLRNLATRTEKRR